MNNMVDEAVDVAALMDRLEGDEDLLGELVALYLDDEPGLVDQITRAVRAGDAEALGRAAHALKGSVGNFCAPGAQAAALALESAGRDGAMAMAPAFLERLSDELGRVRATLQRLAGTG